MGLIKIDDFPSENKGNMKEEIKVSYATRLEPVVYVRLGDEEISVKAEDFNNVINELAIKGSVYAHEVNSLIADYLLRTGQIKVENTGGLDKYYAVSRNELQSLRVQSMDIVEKMQEGYKCSFQCRECGQTHYINSNQIKVLLSFAIRERIYIEYHYWYFPYHGKTTPEQNKAFDNYRELHRMEPVGYFTDVGLKQAITEATEKIYIESGARANQIYIYGIPYRTFINSFIWESDYDEDVMAVFMKKIHELEKQNHIKTTVINEMKNELEKIEKEKQFMQFKAIEASERREFNKAGKLQYVTIPALQKRYAKKQIELWSLLIEDYRIYWR